jgi:tRNA A37 methylthiotransferase MiaB
MRELVTSGPESFPDISVDLGAAEPVDEELRFTLSEPAAVEDSGVTFPSKLDEIMPVIEMALDHGEDIDKVRHSLVSSGYSKRDIEDAISKLNIVEK